MILNVNLITICFITCLESSLTINVNLPHGFNHKDTTKFRGFNAFHFDGKHLNPFDYEIDEVFHRYAVMRFKSINLINYAFLLSREML
jgi:hypothetical protein